MAMPTAMTVAGGRQSGPVRKDSFTDRIIRALLIVLAVLVVVALAFSARMGALRGGMRGAGFTGRGPSALEMMQGPWRMWPMGVGLSGQAMLMLWGALLIIVVLVARIMGRDRGPDSSPLDVMKRRYAAGQITREEYEQMRKDLEQ